MNIESKSLDISRQRQYVTGYGVFEKTPKTDSGTRSISLSGTIAEILSQYRKAQIANRLQLGPAWVDSDNVFIHEDGTPMHPNRPYRWFVEFLEQYNMPKITFHQLRHTNASLLIAAGVDVVTLSGRLGHADKKVTLNTYSHVIKTKEQQAANQMDDIYNQLKPKSTSLTKINP